MYDDDAKGTSLLLAFLAGAVAGAAIAVLTSPQSGPETRNQLRGWASDAGEQIPRRMRGAYARASDAARQAFNDALDRN